MSTSTVPTDERSRALTEAADAADSEGHHWSGAPARAFFALAEHLRDRITPPAPVTPDTIPVEQVEAAADAIAEWMMEPTTDQHRFAARHALAAAHNANAAPAEVRHPSYYSTPGGHSGLREDCRICPPTTDPTMEP